MPCVHSQHQNKNGGGETGGGAGGRERGEIATITARGRQRGSPLLLCPSPVQDAKPFALTSSSPWRIAAQSHLPGGPPSFIQHTISLIKRKEVGLFSKANDTLYPKGCLCFIFLNYPSPKNTMPTWQCDCKVWLCHFLPQKALVCSPIHRTGEEGAAEPQGSEQGKVLPFHSGCLWHPGDMLIDR